METFFDRMGWLIDEFGNGRPHTFGRKAGIPKGSMQKYVSERIPIAKHLVRIHEIFGVNLNWLFTGKGERLIGKDTQKIDRLQDDLNKINREFSEFKAAVGYNEIRKDDPPAKKLELLKLRKA